MENSAELTDGVITLITYLFFIYLILALFIERTVEVLVSAMRYMDYRMGGYRLWNRLAERERKRLDRLYRYQGKDNKSTDKLFSWLFWDVVIPKPYEGGKDIISAEAIRIKYIRNSSRVIAFLLAFGFSVFTKVQFDVDLISLFEEASQSKLIAVNEPLRILLTAVLLSAGSEPLHQLIAKVERVGKNHS